MTTAVAIVGIMLADLPALALEHKAQTARELLAAELRRHGKLVYASSLGAEAMVLTDIVWSHLPEIEVFTIDTGRLFAEAYQLIERLELRYRRKIRVVSPDGQALEQLAATQGVNAFYHGKEARLRCCQVRKLEPFRRAVAGYPAWVTGVRREQSAGRATGSAHEWDARNGLYKISPLLEWSEQEVWQYIHTRQLPYNPLHDHRFPSIGCAPCTRATQPGESRRAGRWWWEQPESRECGLHPGRLAATAGI